MEVLGLDHSIIDDVREFVSEERCIHGNGSECLDSGPCSARCNGYPVDARRKLRRLDLSTFADVDTGEFFHVQPNGMLDRISPRKYACDQCDKAFRKSGDLKTHKRTHTGEKPYKCDQCDEAFSQHGNLETHKRTHTGEKPYKCDQCDRSFSKSGGLKTHKRTHTGEKPYKCDICDKTFNQSTHLQSHVKRRHNDTYVARRKIQEQRVCDALVTAGLCEWFHPEMMPPIGYFKREKRIDFRCVDADDTWCRLDFVVGVSGGYVFLECDEHQHQFGYDASLSCDMKRMAKVMASLTMEAGEHVPRITWLRYNPHACHVDGELYQMLKADREAWLGKYVKEMTLTDPLSIAYAFYDSTEGELEVLQNEYYHREFRCVASDITPMGNRITSDAPGDIV